MKKLVNIIIKFLLIFIYLIIYLFVINKKMNISKNIIKFFEIRKIFLYDIIIIINILKSLSQGNKDEIYKSEFSYINIKVK